MARNVFFSFHYQDVIDFRANVVRHSHHFRKEDKFRDGSIWEEAEEKKIKSLKKLIDEELFGKSVTCVLIGSKTYSRRFVRYEIAKSFALKKGILGVHINWIKGKDQSLKLMPGNNPLEYLRVVISSDGKEIVFQEYNDSGFFGEWNAFRDLPSIKNEHFNEKHFGKKYELTELFNTYSYSFHNGKTNFPLWIEEAAKKVVRK